MVTVLSVLLHHAYGTAYLLNLEVAMPSWTSKRNLKTIYSDQHTIARHLLYIVHIVKRLV